MAMPKVTVVMPAYKAEKTLEATYREIPKGAADEIILVDDYGKDKTAEIARSLGIITVVHEKNRGYGGNQKTCYREALARGADIVVMLHPDYQYDPARLPDLIRPLIEGKADVVYGSRMLSEKGAQKGRMPAYKQLGNRMLTFYYNLMLGTRLTDAATGYIAYSRKILESVPFQLNSDGYTFDEEMIIQCVAGKFRIAEVPIPTKYETESHSISFQKAVGYGGKLFLKVLRYKLHQLGIRSRQFEIRREECGHFRDGALSHPLLEDSDFLVVCDVHPLMEGHILIIPKRHTPCMAALDDEMFGKFRKLYLKAIGFLKREYGSYAAFEHGVTGQTVSHAHFHLLPFKGKIGDIVPEKEALRELAEISELRRLYHQKGKYLFIQLNEKLWCVDTKIGFPRIFRDRIAAALGHPERGDWKKAEENRKLMKEFAADVRELEAKWREQNQHTFLSHEA